MSSILAVGDLMVEVCFQVDDHLSVAPDLIATDCVISCGGSAANFAACLGRLDLGVKLLSHTGTDLLSEMLISELLDSNVAVADVTRIAGGTSATSIIIGPDAERRFISYRSQAEPELDFDDFNYLLTDVHWVHISGFVFQRPGSASQALNLIIAARKKRIPISIDPSPHFAQHIERSRDRLLPLIDYLFPNEYEAQSLTGINDPVQAGAALVKCGVQTVVVTLGAAGSIICTKDGTTSVPGLPAKKLRDTTGAGDAFAAGFIAATRLAASHSSAAKIGNYLAAGVISEIGGHCGAPTLAALRECSLKSQQAGIDLDLLF